MSRRRKPTASADCIGDGGWRRNLRRLARAQDGQLRAIEDERLDHRRGCKGHDRVSLPIDAGDAALIKGNFLEERPTGCLRESAFELIAQPIGIDHLARVSGNYDALERDLRRSLRSTASLTMMAQ